MKNKNTKSRSSKSRKRNLYIKGLGLKNGVVGGGEDYQTGRVDRRSTA